MGYTKFQARKAFTCTPSDTVNVWEGVPGIDGAESPSSLYVGVAGDVAVIFEGNQDSEPVTLVGVAAGSFLPVSVRKVLATGTTATNILLLW